MCEREMLLSSLVFPRPFAEFAVKQLSAVDYNVANRVTEGVADIVQFSYAHDVPWIAQTSVQLLQSFDDFGSTLIALVVWIVQHTQ